MSRDKQIEEMAKDALTGYEECDNNINCSDCIGYKREIPLCQAYVTATALYNAGYRKAEEIFADLDKAIGELAMKYSDEGLNDYFGVCEVILTKVIYPIRKKYTESEVAERREDIENSPADCSTPSVTDSKGERNEHGK